MAEIKLKEFKGFSGSQVFLLQDQEKIFVRKQGNITRNLERYNALQGSCNLPKIYKSEKNILDLEYISGLDIKQFIKYKKVDILIDFLVDVIKNFNKSIIEKDYTPIYEKKLKWIEKSDIQINFSELIKKLPKILPKSLYHGDFTFENIIFSTDKNEFYLIDPLTSDYDSFIFDLAKLRQDLESQWFIRHEKHFLDVHLSTIQNNVFSKLGIKIDNYLLILMLLRVYPYCTKNSYEQIFLKREIERLWK